MSTDVTSVTPAPEGPPSSDPPVGPQEATIDSRETADRWQGDGASVPEPDEIPSALGLTAGDRRFLWVAGGLILLLAIIHWARLSGFGQREIEITRLPERQFDFRVDINHATWVEWMQLEGIGELTARKIVADRQERGLFQSIDDVDRVPGIGPKTLAAIRPWLICSDCGTNAPPASPRK